ncbi:MAG: hypothetical protein ABIQ88_02340 [Chitinophagaceae bacterium]
MEKKFLQQLLPLPHLNAEKLEQLIKLEESADPLPRLLSDYYKTIRHEYFADFQRNSRGHHIHSTEYEQKRDELENLTKELRARYVKDLELACELFLVSCNIWNPYRVKVTSD